LESDVIGRVGGGKWVRMKVGGKREIAMTLCCGPTGADKAASISREAHPYHYFMLYFFTLLLKSPPSNYKTLHSFAISPSSCILATLAKGKLRRNKERPADNVMSINSQSNARMNALINRPKV
jgi:hypothetical protein